MNGLVNVNDCSNDNLLMDWDEMLADIPNNRVIKLWDNTCFDIDELAQVLIGSNGQNQNPIPGNTNRIWKSRDDLLTIVNFPTLEPEYKTRLTQILANDLAQRPPHIDIFIRHPDILTLLGETGIFLLSDYTDNFNISLEALGTLSEEISKKGEADANIIFNVTNSKGKKLNKTLGDIPKLCIHGGGFNLAGYYCKIYLELEEVLGKEEMERQFPLHPGYHRLSKICNDCILFGYPLVKYEKLGICMFSMEKSEQLDGGTGRIGNWTIHKSKLTDDSVFGYSYPIARQLREKIMKDYKSLFNDTFLPYYMQRYYESAKAYQKAKQPVKQPVKQLVKQIYKIHPHIIFRHSMIHNMTVGKPEIKISNKVLKDGFDTKIFLAKNIEKLFNKYQIDGVASIIFAKKTSKRTTYHVYTINKHNSFPVYAKLDDPDGYQIVHHIYRVHLDDYHVEDRNYVFKNKFIYRIFPTPPQPQVIIDGLINTNHTLIENNLSLGLTKGLTDTPKAKTIKIKVKKDKKTKKSSPKTTKKDCNKDLVCPNDKICNTKTGRCISKSGILGQKLLKEQANIVKPNTPKKEELTLKIRRETGSWGYIFVSPNNKLNELIDILLGMSLGQGVDKSNIRLKHKEFGTIDSSTLDIVKNYTLTELGVRNEDEIIVEPIVVKSNKCEIEVRDKYFIVRGEDTKHLKEDLHKLNGKWNGTPAFMGWTFKTNMLNDIQHLLTKHKYQVSMTNNMTGPKNISPPKVKLSSPEKVKSPKKVKSPQNTKKDCTKDYQCPSKTICNPDTGRCVSENSTTALNIAKKLLLISNHLHNEEKPAEALQKWEQANNYGKPFKDTWTKWASKKINRPVTGLSKTKKKLKIVNKTKALSPKKPSPPKVKSPVDIKGKVPSPLTNQEELMMELQKVLVKLDDFKKLKPSDKEIENMEMEINIIFNEILENPNVNLVDIANTIEGYKTKIIEKNKILLTPKKSKKKLKLVVKPQTPLKSKTPEKTKNILPEVCFDLYDPLLMEQLDDYQEEDIFMYGDGDKKHCYDLENFYQYYKSLVDDGKKEIQDPMTGKILTDNDILNLNQKMKAKCIKEGKPFKEAKYVLEELDTNKVRLTFRPAGSYYHIIIERDGYSNLDLGYIPADIETGQGGLNTGNANETTGALIQNLDKLFEKRRLLTKHHPVSKIKCCTIKNLGKSKEYWRTPPKDELKKFKQLVYEVEEVLQYGVNNI